MDHLPWKDQLPRGRPAVPFLCAGSEDDICGDIDEFNYWPIVKGWDLTSPTIFEAAKWCQAWLFFGFLRILTESLHRTFSVEAYICKHNSGVLDSQPVTELLTTFMKANPTWSGIPLSHFARTLYRVLGGTLRIYSPWIITSLQKYESQHQTPDPWTLELFNVFWSSLLLFELFCDLYPNLRDDQDISGLYSALPLLTQKTRTISGALLIFGRCPTVLNRTDLSPMKAYKLLAIPISRNADHTLCRNRHCKALDANRQDDQIQHDVQCEGRCPIVRISLQGLEIIIENNLIPLVRSTINASGTLIVDIVNGTDINDYTAISHIWARGLGNFDENAHFECQLRQLHIDLFSEKKTWYKHDGYVYYWIDTLCVPLTEGALKTKAIDSIAAIYAGARKILVIDPELRFIDSRNMSTREVNLAVSCSPWMARSWTLLEGALAVKIYIRFKDGLVSLETLGNELVQGLWDRDVTRSNYYNQYSPITQRKKFLTAWNELCCRSTTISEDIVAILAVFIGRSAGEVLSLPPEQRMHALLRTQKKLPTSILFTPTDLRSTEWSPAFPSSHSEEKRLESNLGYLEFTEDGQFLLSGIKDIGILHCSQNVTVCGQITVYDKIQDRCYHIDFGKAAPKEVESYANVLLLFTPFSSNRDGISNGTGIICVTVEAQSEEFQAQFLKRFEWTCHMIECNASTIDSSFTCKTHYRVASPIGESYFTHENRLVLDMGVQVWPQLTWLRQDFYPFLETSIRMAQPQRLFQTQAWFSYVYSGLYFFAHMIKDEHGIHFLAGIIFICCRRYLAGIEDRYIRNWSHRILQTKWAASFMRSRSEGNRVSRNTRRVIFLVLIYGTLLISSTAGLTVLWTRRYRQLDCGDDFSEFFLRCLAFPGPLFFFLGLDYSGLFPFALLVCLALSIELLFRILFIILFSSHWRNQRPQEVLRRECERDSDPKDRWRVLFIKITVDAIAGGFLVFILFMIWVFITTDDENIQKVIVIVPIMMSVTPIMAIIGVHRFYDT